MGRTYNLAGDQILTLDEYFASIAGVLGVKLAPRRIPADFFRQNARLWDGSKRKFDFGFNWVNYESAFDITALRKAGFGCLTDHDTGVARTLEWLDANRLIPQSSDQDMEDLIQKELQAERRR